jgi:hypothetical protein
MRGNGKVTVRRMTREERKTFRKRTVAEMLLDIPRSRLVTADVKQVGNGGFGLDVGGKYWR